MLSEGIVTTNEWLHVFRKSIPAYKRAAAADPAVPEAARPAAVEAFERAFAGVLDALERDPTLEEVDGFVTAPLSCATLCRARDQALHRAGFFDIFKPLKDRENDLALKLLPGVLRELDAEPDAGRRLELALRGVFAGNIFDQGCAETAARTDSSGEGGASGTFAATRAQLLPRPWAVDDLDALLSHFASRPQPHRKAILFVDNAGPDVVLGMVPLARELLKRGTQVVLAANEAPSINDITAGELRPLLARAADADPLLARCLAERALRVVSSGNDLGVIDLSEVSREVAAEAEDGCDLVVCEGMGRGIETNLRAAFGCDSAKLGMIKHPEVARLLNGRMYDIVCKFDPAPAGQ
ncbi:hypothetical protein Rsub_13064 [Raphidocelis subcapitata]|uniref:Damage-control phosphatase ARMT1-like metal-binding domain-containing protein n=1 Tax=Raphidocelis subcapitata TaxID=307507 RepID=A0A2V0PKH0_9CHLO|nr:hypothetical protein Rsub_13064 [Raphidocelis subcapitata]|eukprot:GBG00302.1 hypothetical protein Rsub_13064 [Raphidocelis subcapitata]